MGSDKVVTCKRMVKTFSIEADNPEVSAMVFIMAVITFVIFYFFRRVITSAINNQLAYFIMAVKAFFVGYLFTQFMTFSAVADTLKGRVSACEFPGGNLCPNNNSGSKK